MPFSHSPHTTRSGCHNMPPHSACHIILNKHSAQSSKLNHFVDVAPLAGGTLLADEQEMEKSKQLFVWSQTC